MLFVVLVVETTVSWCSSEPRGPRLFTPRSTGRENKALVPRSKITTGYYSVVSSLSFVVVPDPSLLLTQSVFAIGFTSVAERWCATAHSRAWGPTHSCGCLDVHLSDQSYSS